MKDISIAGIDRRSLFGRNDQHLAYLEKRYGIRLVARGDKLTLKGTDASVREADGFLSHLIKRMRHGPPLEAAELENLIHCSPTLPKGDHDTLSNPVAHTYKTAIYARTEGQAKYLAAIDNNDVVFSIGPAGTGKTYLAVAMAVAALRQKQISRILLARPAVEAGEKLGFLPGSFEDKVDPYLRPLYYALQDLMESERLRRMQDMKIVEVVPLAYMRGRTLNDSFIILDEAQNTTPQQMKMFLTRLGSHSKAVVTGDITQTDLSDDQPSGLIVAPKILTGIAGLAFVRLNERDVVRNPLVQKIIKAYDSYGEAHDSADS
ncbi:MAG: PhoH family protein [Gemmatimonadetes bacterium]|nr:PhoH family protein [Gemmatimonadota bacterium]